MKKVFKSRSAILMLVLLSLMIVSSISSQEEAPKVAEGTLYDRLGGVYGIATVCDELINRLDANDILNANPLIEKTRSMVPLAGIKFRLTALFCQLTGGPQVYNGRDMKGSHAHLNISEAEWNEMVRVFTELLNEFKVPEKEQGEIFALIAPTKADIVTANNNLL